MTHPDIESKGHTHIATTWDAKGADGRHRNTKASIGSVVHTSLINGEHIMKKFLLFTMLMTALAAFGTGAAWAGDKVKVCHVPPGNPGNFHTITISDKALPKHLAHGDEPGTCFENANTLCDDGNTCTIDAMDEASETCLVEHAPVDCNDSDLCTTDSCDPANGCQSAPILCDDGDACTVDVCNSMDGQCSGTEIDCGALGVCLPATGSCDFPCDGITCEPLDQCHQAGDCSVNGAGQGVCSSGVPVVDGTPCDDGDDATANDVCGAEGFCSGVIPVVEPPDYCVNIDDPSCTEGGGGGKV